jgi:hypothetical protein
MKQPLEWHEKNLQNSTEYERRTREELERQLRNLDEVRRGNELARLQVETAKAKGITEYDADRFCVTKKQPITA